MLPEPMHSFVRYNNWANQRILDAAGTLPDSGLVRDLGGSFSSIQKTMAHIIWVEQLFLRRWQGLPNADLADSSKFETAAILKEAVTGIERDQQNYLDRLTEADLFQPISYIDTRGRPVSMLLWQSLLHLLSHSTFHRGQAVSKFRELGCAPPATDFILFCGETRKD
jgi:uncharacterized damage-inducible protein DinB